MSDAEQLALVQSYLGSRQGAVDPAVLVGWWSFFDDYDFMIRGIIQTRHSRRKDIEDLR